MKNKTLVGMMVAALVIAGTTVTAFAQNGPAKNGCGYGTPPKSAEERAARQAACLEKNGGVCPNGGPRANCPGMGAGKGQGQGKGQCQGKGACDGTGPKGPNGKGPRSGQGR